MPATSSSSHAGWAFGEVAVTYSVHPAGSDRCRLVVRVVSRLAAGGPGAALLGRLFPWLDLLMMRRQLLNLKRLAEGQPGEC